jgi:hypothetical protein
LGLAPGKLVEVSIGLAEGTIVSAANTRIDAALIIEGDPRP